MSKSKSKPILFNGEMVRAILDGRKTVTRRVMKPQPFQDGPRWEGNRFERIDQIGQAIFSDGTVVRCPCGQPGDVGWSVGLPPADGLYYVKGFSEDRPVWLRQYKAGLLWGYNERDDPEAIEIEGLETDTIEWKRPGDTLWVRETWATPGNYDHIKPSELMASEFDSSLVVYRATAEYGDVYYKWRPSIYMPRWASRITLRVKSVRVERVQEISNVDARAEGVYALRDERALFAQLWDSINSKRGFGWHVNPFVWVVEFEVLAND